MMMKRKESVSCSRPGRSSSRSSGRREKFDEALRQSQSQCSKGRLLIAWQRAESGKAAAADIEVGERLRSWRLAAHHHHYHRIIA